jgi:hypothetical protein
VTGQRAAGSWRSLAALAAAQAAGQAGTWAALTAALPAALARPHPAVWLSVVTVAWAAPAALIRVAGAPIDHYGPRAAAVASWAAAALAALALVVAAQPGMPALVAVLAVISLAGGAGVAAGDTAPTWLPHRPDLARAGAWLTAGADVSVGAGALAGSSLVTAAGPRLAWLLVALLSAAGAVLSAVVPARRPASSFAGGIGQAEQPARNHLGVPAVLTATAGIWLGYGVITILESLYVRRVLHDPLTIYGWLLAAWATAGAITAALAHHRPRLITGAWTVPASAALVALGEALYIGTSSFPLSVAGSVLFGCGSAWFGLGCRAVLVSATPPQRHGRMLATWRALQFGCDIAPAACTGTLVDTIGLRAVLALAPIFGLAAATCALTAARRRPVPPAQPARWPHRSGMTWAQARADHHNPPEEPGDRQRARGR